MTSGAAAGPPVSSPPVCCWSCASRNNAPPSSLNIIIIIATTITIMMMMLPSRLLQDETQESHVLCLCQSQQTTPVFSLKQVCISFVTDSISVVVSVLVCLLFSLYSFNKINVPILTFI